MASRNLTYLGNPFQQGLGKATVVDTSGVADDFIKGMESVRANRKADNDAIKKEKADQQKSVEDYKVDYFINHQSHFQGAVDDVRKEGIDLMMKGYNLKDYKNPEVAEYQKKKIGIDSDAKLSKEIGTYMEKVLNLTPEQKGKIKAESYKSAIDFLDLPFDEQVKAFKNGTMAKLEVLNELPIEKFKSAIAEINTGLPNLSNLTQAELDVVQQDAVEKAKTFVRQNITDDMINSTDPKVIQQEREDYAEAYGNLVKRPFEDLKSKSEAAAKLKENENKNAIEWAKIRNAQAKTALDKAKWSAAQRAFEDYDGFIDNVVDGNLDNIGTFEDIMTVTVKNGTKDVEYKPTIEVKGKDVIDPTIILGLQQEKYVTIKYPTNAKIATKKIKIRNYDGSDNIEGIEELKGFGRIPFNNQAAKSGVKNTGTKAGSTIGSQSNSTEKRSTNTTSTQNGASGGKKIVSGQKDNGL